MDHRRISVALVAICLTIQVVGCEDKFAEEVLSTFFGECEYCLSILQPTIGDSIAKGRSYMIKWESKKRFEYIRITLMRGLTSVGSTTSLSGSVLDSSRYNLDFSSSIPDGNDYRIRIEGQVKNNYSVVAESPLFSIYTLPLQVIIPNGGESLIPGQSYRIVWAGGPSESSLNLELWSASNFNQTIVTQVQNDGEYVWTVPATVTNGTSYRINISVNGTPNENDFSDGNFTISSRPLAVEIPNGGNSFVLGEIYPIYWSGGIQNGSVRIDLYRGTTIVETITNSTSSPTGLYEWYIPLTQLTASDYYIRIIQSSTSAQSVTSFTIGQPVLSSVNRYEPNDSLSSAFGPLVQSQHYVAYIGSSTDVDYYYVDIVSIKHLRAYLVVPSGNDFELALLKSNGTTIQNSTGYGNEYLSENLD